jgi:hypothetical protein
LPPPQRAAKSRPAYPKEKDLEGNFLRMREVHGTSLITFLEAASGFEPLNGGFADLLEGVTIDT